MKKIFTALLVVALLFSLAACGENEESNSTPTTSGESSTTAPQWNGGTSSETPTESTTSNNSPNMTKEEFLALFGLSEDDIQPNGFANYEIWGCISNEGTVYIQIDEAGGVSENVQAWFEKIFDKIKQISDDGKLYNSLAFDTEYKLPTSYGKSAFSQFIYKYNGKGVVVNLGFDPFGFGLSNNEIKKISAYEIIFAMQ
ncbi:MAG: hypothetical protein LBQ48_05685 [Oscillospiraceae bacterium]|jgi:hypothetical protein|nr:hypothetical protein [Oscillospiraceae bacterium]